MILQTLGVRIGQMQMFFALLKRISFFIFFGMTVCAAQTSVNDTIPAPAEANPESILANLNNIPAIYKKIPPSSLEQTLKMRLVPANAIGNKKQQGRINNDLGLIALHNQDFHAALDYFGKAFTYKSALKDAAGVATIQTEMGYAYSKTNRTEDALKQYTESFSAFTNLKMPIDAAYVLSLTGQLQGDLKKYGPAAAAFDNAAKKFSKNNFSTEAARCYDRAGDYAFLNNDFVTAKSEYASAVPLKKQINDVAGQAASLRNLGRSFIAGGEYEDAIGPLNKSYILQPDFTTTQLLLQAYQKSAEANKNDPKEYQHFKQLADKLEDSLQKADPAKSAAGSSSSKSVANKTDTKLNLDAITTERDQTEKEIQALQAQLSSANLTNSQMDSIRRIANEKLEKLEKLKTQQELAIKQNELEISRKNTITWILISVAVAIILLAFFLYRQAVHRKKNYQQLAKVNQELVSIQEQLLQAEKYKDQFLANMSHEIRTPMNAVIGMTNLLLEKNPKQEQLRYLNAMKQSADNLLIIINDILDLSKIQAGKMEIEQIPFRLDDTLDAVYNTLRFKAEEKGLGFEVVIADSTPKTVVGDPTRLSQILINLAGNSIKFTEKGEVKIFCEVKVNDQGKAVYQFRVTDTGIGIPEEKIPLLFQKFQQAETSTTRKFGGTGLGLSISKQLVEMQEGEIGVRSEAGKGSEFYFSIPYAVLADGESISQKQKIDLTLLEGIHVLLAEDNEFNRIVAIDTLIELIPGVKVDVAENGQIAYNMVRDKKYALVLMDVQMPELNGYDATDAIRKNLTPPHSQTPVIAMTASATKAEVDRCFEVGMNEFVAKPFEPDELLQKMASVISHS